MITGTNGKANGHVQGKQLDARHSEVYNQQAAIETDIHNTITRLCETLTVRKTELLSELHQLTQEKLKSLESQKGQIQNAQRELESYLHEIREKLKTGNRGEVLMMKSTTVWQAKKLTSTLHKDMLQPDIEADIIFSALADLSSECSQLKE